MKFKKPKRWVNKIFVHCTAADTYLLGNKLKKWVWRIHVGGQPHHWSDIGYHYLIDKAGGLIPCRPLEKVPAANANNKGIKGFHGNTGTIAICLDGLDKNEFTDAQFETLRKLCKEIDEAYKSKVTFHGHREIAWKECPVFDYKKVLELDKHGNLGY